MIQMIQRCAMPADDNEESAHMIHGLAYKTSDVNMTHLLFHNFKSNTSTIWHTEGIVEIAAWVCTRIHDLVKNSNRFVLTHEYEVAKGQSCLVDSSEVSAQIFRFAKMMI